MKAVDKIILGTVQFGLDYGINNSVGKASGKEVEQILDFAKSVGINTLDTAAAYGDAEDKIGNYHLTSDLFFVNTKFDKKNNVDWEISLQYSLRKLKIPIVETVMFHSFEAYYQQNERLSILISKGRGVYFNRLGVSVYTNDELEQLMNDEYVEVIQLPFNLLDNESLRGDVLRRLKANGKTIHVRSVFLQGLFYKNIGELPNNLLDLTPHLAVLQEIAYAQNISMNVLALQYVCSKNYIDGVLMGVDNKSQLEENIQALSHKVNKSVFAEIDRIKVENVELLNPSKW